MRTIFKNNLYKGNSRCKKLCSLWNVSAPLRYTVKFTRKLLIDL